MTSVITITFLHRSLFFRFFSRGFSGNLSVNKLNDVNSNSSISSCINVITNGHSDLNIDGDHEVDKVGNVNLELGEYLLSNFNQTLVLSSDDELNDNLDGRKDFENQFLVPIKVDIILTGTVAFIHLHNEFFKSFNYDL